MPRARRGGGPAQTGVDDRGTVWSTGDTAAYVGRPDPATGAIVRSPMPDPAPRAPHTLVLDRAGDLGFAVQGGYVVGKLSHASGEVKLLPVPTVRARPYGIAIDSRGMVWIDGFGSRNPASADPATLRLREHPLPAPDARTRRLAITWNEAVWCLDYGRGSSRPAGGGAPVVFHLAGNAADGDGSPLGDRACTVSVEVAPAHAPAGRGDTF